MSKVENKMEGDGREDLENEGVKVVKDKDIIIPRSITLLGSVSFIVGTIIGSGIFITPKGVAEGSGSVALTLITWTLCGILSMLAALCYAEMATVVKESGGDYAFFSEAFGAPVAFIFAWCWGLLLKPASMATLALTISQYIITPFFRDSCGAYPVMIDKLLAIFFILLLAATSIYSTELSSKIQIVFTIGKLAALGIIILGGIVMLFMGHTENLATGFEGTSTHIGTIALGFYSGVYAYDGWNAANFITDEIINPERNLPLAIIISLPLVTLVYVLTNVSYFTVVSVQGMLDSSAIAMTWAETVIPNFAWLIPIFVAMSSFGSLNGALFSTARLVFVAAKKEHMPRLFGMVHVKRFTPVSAAVLMAICSICFVIPGNTSSLVTFVSFIKWMFYGLNMVSLIIFRFKSPYKDAPRTLKVPLVIPIIVLLSSIFIVVVPIATNPQIEFILALIFVLIGFVFYVPLVHFKLCPKFMVLLTAGIRIVCIRGAQIKEATDVRENSVTVFIQLFFEVSTAKKSN